MYAFGFFLFVVSQKLATLHADGISDPVLAYPPTDFNHSYQNMPF
jgi:hypothetical protein